MNFLIVRDFSRIFLIFDEFIWIYFELKRIKNQILSRANMAVAMARAKKASPHGGV